MQRLPQYADLADDDKSRERLGKAFNLLLGDWGNVSHSDGFSELIRNESGLRDAVAASQARVSSKAMADLTPREREYFNAMMSAMSTVIALRSLTKAPAAKFSADAIENELPFIGRGASVVSRKDFAQKLKMLGSVIENGTEGVPKNMWRPGELEAIKASSDLHQNPSPKGNLSAPPRTAEEYLKSMAH
jgi:hypothetical protein